MEAVFLFGNRANFTLILSIQLLMLFSMISNNKSEGFSRNKGLFPFNSLQQRDSCAHCLFYDEDFKRRVENTSFMQT